MIDSNIFDDFFKTVNKLPLNEEQKKPLSDIKVLFKMIDSGKIDENKINKIKDAYKVK